MCNANPVSGTWGEGGLKVGLLFSVELKYFVPNYIRSFYENLYMIYDIFINCNWVDTQWQ